MYFIVKFQSFYFFFFYCHLKTILKLPLMENSSDIQININQEKHVNNQPSPVTNFLKFYVAKHCIFCLCVRTVGSSL